MPQQQQQEQPACTGDCVIQTVLTEGVCKEEFLAFDSCFDAAHATGGDEEACTPLFDKFRACMKTKSTISNAVQQVIGK